jgi:hypothetical protein
LSRRSARCRLRLLPVSYRARDGGSSGVAVSVPSGPDAIIDGRARTGNKKGNPSTEMPWRWDLREPAVVSGNVRLGLCDPRMRQYKTADRGYTRGQTGNRSPSGLRIGSPKYQHRHHEHSRADCQPLSYRDSAWLANASHPGLGVQPMGAGRLLSEFSGRAARGRFSGACQAAAVRDQSSPTNPDRGWKWSQRTADGPMNGWLPSCCSGAWRLGPVACSQAQSAVS